MQLLLQELREQMLLLESLLDPPNLPHAPGDISPVAVGQSYVSSFQVVQFSQAPASLQAPHEQWDPVSGKWFVCSELSVSCILQLPDDPSTLFLKLKLMLQV